MQEEISPGSTLPWQIPGMDQSCCVMSYKAGCVSCFPCLPLCQSLQPVNHHVCQLCILKNFLIHTVLFIHPFLPPRLYLDPCHSPPRACLLILSRMGVLEALAYHFLPQCTWRAPMSAEHGPQLWPPCLLSL